VTAKRWICPIPFSLVVTGDGESFREHGPGVTGLPVAQHPGAFGVVRKHHVHEGVDLYCPSGTEVRAVEAGRVVEVLPFTGALAGLPWWLDTEAVLVEGASGVVLYGEISAAVAVGAELQAGDLVGNVTRVLRNDKGRPTSMLHLELHVPATRALVEWYAETGRPASLCDPTSMLRDSIPRPPVPELR
jgi:murein DD-endopeptidase MepM/ murein hydrolase activator NlpD